MTRFSFSFLLLAVFCTVLSSTLIKFGFRNKKFGLNLKTFKLVITKPILIAAGVLCVVASLSWASVIVHSDISTAIPIYSSFLFVTTFLFGYFVFDEKINFHKVIGILFIIIGITIIFKP